MLMLEQSLRRLQTDHLDLWQIHGASFPNDPELFIRQNGAAEALKKFNDGRYELFKSTMKYDGEIGRQQHDCPTIEKLPA